MKDARPRPVTSDIPEAIGVASGVKGFILWLGGSLAGITALLYACGYLVTRAHLHMLGLYGFVEFENEHFLQEGAKFFLSVAYDLAGTAVLFFTLIGLVLVPVAAFSLLGRRRLKPLLQRVTDWRGRNSQVSRNLRGLSYVVLLATLIWLTGISLNPFYAPLCVADLLYSSGGSNECGANAELRQLSSVLKSALLAGDSERLALHFGERLSQVLYFVLMTCMAWPTVARWRSRSWLIAPFLVSMGLFLLLLPMDYGVLQRPTVYPVIRLHAAATTGNGTDTMYLLDKTDSEFIVWDSIARKVVWLPAGGLEKAEIVRIGNLFHTAAGATPPPGGKR